MVDVPTTTAFDSLQLTVSSQGVDIVALESDLTDIQEDVDILQLDVEALKVGQPPTAPTQPPPTSGGGGFQARYVIATPDAPSAVRSAANLNLGAVSSVGDALNTALNNNQYVYITGPSIKLDKAVVVDKTINILSDGTRIVNPQTLPASSNNRPAGFKINGQRGDFTGWALNTTLVKKGTNTFTFNTLPTNKQFTVGKWLQIRSTETHNTNRPQEYYKGELLKIAAVNGKVVTFSNTFRDDYTVSAMTLHDLTMLDNVVVDGLEFEAHPNASTRQEVFVLQDAENSVIRNSKVYGKYAGWGIAVWRSVNIVLENLYAENIYDAYGATIGYHTGYGVYISGCENVYARNINGFQCKHLVDIGNGGASSYPNPRHITIDGGVARRTWATGYGTHGADDVRFINLTSLGCGGGFHMRGQDSLIDNCRVYGVHRDKPDEYVSTLSDMASITVGEESSKEGGNRGGIAGTRLVIKNTVIENVNPYLKAPGIRVVDPLIDSYIEAQITSTGDPFYADGDTIENNTINLVINDEYLESNSGYVSLVPKDGGTNPQYVAFNNLTVNARKGRQTGVRIGGGRRGGISQNNKLDIQMQSVQSPATAATPQLRFEAGAHGTYLIERFVVPGTNKATAVSDAGTGTALVWNDNGLFDYV